MPFTPKLCHRRGTIKPYSQNQITRMITAEINSFVAVDVETAAPISGAICQIGMAFYQDGELERCRSFLIRPKTAFTHRFVQVHGIRQEDVRCAPVWRDIYPEIARELHGRTIVSHTVYDRQQIFAACCRSGSTMFSYGRWVDTCNVARLAWPGLPSYTLIALARHLGVMYTPHQAVEDARAAGAVLLLAQRVLRGGGKS